MTPPIKVKQYEAFQWKQKLDGSSHPLTSDTRRFISEKYHKNGRTARKAAHVSPQRCELSDSPPLCAVVLLLQPYVITRRREAAGWWKNVTELLQKRGYLL
ncbi:hypothetical protein AOLI_G00193540 [Acnodon oligacanthus]